MSNAAPGRSRRHASRSGNLGLMLFGVAFACVLIAGAILGVAAKEFFKTTVTLWTSVGFSVLAIVLAIASLVRRGSRS